MTDTFWADISSWQVALNDHYPWPVVAFRADYGTGIDSNAAVNWHWALRSPQIKAAIAYIVFKPTQSANILARVKALFGATCPAKLVFMIDMESGSEFAGSGNHGTEANSLASSLASYAGSQKRVIAYANRYDYASCWPNISPWLKRVTASYGTSDPGTWGWQYYGGASANSSPNGYPRACAPFGSNVDMNVTHRTLSQTLLDLGLTSPPVTEDIVDQAQFDKFWNGHINRDQNLVNPARTDSILASLQKDFLALKAEQDAINAKIDRLLAKAGA